MPACARLVASVNEATPQILLALAWTRKGPPVPFVAVSTPFDVIVPPPFTLHENAGWMFSALPNASSAVAVNCCVPPGDTSVMVGTTLMFTARAGIADLLTPALTSYMGRLGQREGFQRAFKRAFG